MVHAGQVFTPHFVMTATLSFHTIASCTPYTLCLPDEWRSNLATMTLNLLRAICLRVDALSTLPPGPDAGHPEEGTTVAPGAAQEQLQSQGEVKPSKAQSAEQARERFVAPVAGRAQSQLDAMDRLGLVTGMLAAFARVLPTLGSNLPSGGNAQSMPWR
jgi:hypothetical protein